MLCFYHFNRIWKNFMLSFLSLFLSCLNFQFCTCECQLTCKKHPHIHNHRSFFWWGKFKVSLWSSASQEGEEEEKKNPLPTLMTLADRKWLQGTLAVLMKESPSVVAVVRDFSDGLGESVTRAILAATESMSAAGWQTAPTDQTEGLHWLTPQPKCNPSLQTLA